MSMILRYYQDDSWLAVLGKYSPAVGFGWILRLFGAVYETHHLDSIRKLLNVPEPGLKARQEDQRLVDLSVPARSLKG